MNRLSRYLFLAGAVAGCVAAVALSILPAGLMPKEGGPCGRILCNCAPADLNSNTCNHHTTQTPAPHKCFFGFSQTQIADADGSRVAFQVVCGAFVLPASSTLMKESFVIEDKIVENFISIDSRSSEIPTPPPRA